MTSFPPLARRQLSQPSPVNGSRYNRNIDFWLDSPSENNSSYITLGISFRHDNENVLLFILVILRTDHTNDRFRFNWFTIALLVAFCNNMVITIISY